ncbi:MAG: glycosyltransferase [Blastococcus sp.]|nr:glycosyltransferase [Blastococcus sp.]
MISGPLLPGSFFPGLASIARGARAFVEDVMITVAREMIHRGGALFEEGRAAEAADLLNSAAAALRIVGRQAGDTGRSLTAVGSSLLGQVAAARGDEERARQEFDTAIRVFEESPTMAQEEWAAFASALHGAGQLDRAVQAQAAVVRLDPGEPGPTLRLAAWLREAGRKEDAEKRLRALVARFPKAPDPAVALAEVLRESRSADAPDAVRTAVESLVAAHRYQEALDLLDSAGGDTANQPEAASLRAVALVSVGRPDEAAAELDAAIEQGGEDARLHVQKARALISAGRPQEALEELPGTGPAAVRSAEAAEARGLAWQALGLHDKAVAELREAQTRLGSPSADLYAALGESLHHTGATDDALRALDAAIERNAGHAKALAVRGEVRMERRQFDLAIDDLRRSVALDRDAVRPWASLGEAQRRSGNLDGAVGALRRAVEIDPSDARSRWILGRTLNDQRRLSRAAKELREAVRLAGGFPRASAALGRVYVRLGRLDDALEAFQAALDTAALDTPAGGSTEETGLPDLERAEVLMRIASVHEAQGRIDAAVAALRKAVELCPSPELYTRIAEDLRQAGDLDGALAFARKALHHDSRNAKALTVKGHVLSALGRDKAAATALRRAVKEQPENGPALTLLGDLHNTHHRFVDAEKAFRAALALEPTSAEAHRGLGDVMRQLGRFDEAYAEFEAALVGSPGDRLTHRLLGYTLLTAERPTDALAVFRRALEVAPDDATLMSDVVRANLELEDYGSALETSRRAVDAHPQNAAALVGRGRVLCLVGAFETASAVLRTAAGLDRTDAEAHVWLAWALENQGLDTLPEALGAMRIAVGLAPDEPLYRKELATVLWKSGEAEEAREQFVLALQGIDVNGQDPDEVATAGWCHYGLRQFEEAARRYRRSLRLSGGAVDTYFDLALAELCQGVHDSAVEGYRRGIHRADRKNPLRRRGLLRVALVDMDDARRVGGLSSGVADECREMVETALRRPDPSEPGEDAASSVAELAIRA